MNLQWDWNDDGWIVVAGALCALACSLVGNLLVLRRMSLMGDAISHAVLPGIAIAFVMSGSRSSVVVLVGAAAMGLVTVWLTEVVQRLGHVEESAAIGVVFTALFAIGLVIMVRAADKVDLDPSCVFSGNLETIVIDMIETPFGSVPRVVLVLGCICLLNLAAVVLFFRQWQLTTFDPSLAQSQGISATAFRYLLAGLVALTCIASFEAVGNILVVAMLVVPSSIGFLLCRRLHGMVIVAAVVSIVVAVLGHVGAIAVPQLFGLRTTLNSAAMMAVMCGVLLVFAIGLSPKGGLVARWWIRRKVSRTILSEDMLSLLYRSGESNRPDELEGSSDAIAPLCWLTRQELALRMKVPVARVRSLARDLVRRNWLAQQGERLELTTIGFREAKNLVRSHRLWEKYLATETGVSDPRLHVQAESLEHYTSPALRGKLDQVTGKSTVDPHGRIIPPES